MEKCMKKATALPKNPHNAEVSWSQSSCGLFLEERFSSAFQELQKLQEHIWLKRSCTDPDSQGGKPLHRESVGKGKATLTL